MLKKVKFVGKVAYWLIFGTIVLMGIVLILSTFNTSLGVRVFSVRSESMRPVIPLGSVVVVGPSEKYKEEEIITVRSEFNPKETVTHRIIEVLEDKELKKIQYQIKGDANEEPDPEPIDSRRVIGKVILTVPYLGYAVGFAQTQIGLIVLIVIPSTLIIYSESNSIKDEIKKLLVKKKKKEKNV